MHKTVSTRKKWIKELERRIAGAKRDKINAQKHHFRQYFRTNVTSDQTANHSSDSDADDEEDESKKQATKPKSLSRTAASKMLEDTDSEEDNTGAPPAANAAVPEPKTRHKKTERAPHSNRARDKGPANAQCNRRTSKNKRHQRRHQHKQTATATTQAEQPN